VGAIAVADERANAVGPVRLTCLPTTLRVDLLRVGRFMAGFAFSGLADAVSFEVPYTAVRGMVRQGDRLHLSLDPHAATPYNRFTLTRFSRDPLGVLWRSFRLRAWLRALSWLLPPALGAAAGTQVSGELAGGLIGRLALGVLVTLATHALLRRAVARIVGGGTASDTLAAGFERAVSVRLGLTPASDLAGGPLGPARQDGVIRPGHLMAVSMRPRLFAMAAMLAVGMGLMSVVAVQRYGVADQVLLPVELAMNGVTAPAATVVPRAVDAGTPDHDACHCQRSDSAIWRGSLPQVSVVITPVAGEVDGFWLELGQTYAVTEGKASADDEGEPRIEFDLAAINNSSVPIETVDFVVTFARRDTSNRRRALLERGLHWPGTLDPGEAIKWRVKASGRTELKVDSRLDGRISDAIPLASPFDVARLMRAKLPAVRLHGVMMLAYLGDPRAQALAGRLEGLSSQQARARDRIVDTYRPLKVCAIAAAGNDTTLCAFNGSEGLHRRLELVAGEVVYLLDDLFIAGRGLRFVLPIDPQELPPTFELRVP
jgi:hypothetical protein